MPKGIVPTVGRNVLCFHPTKWRGALPGIIIMAHGDRPESLINVKVFGDGHNFGGFDVHNMMSVRIYSPEDLTASDLPADPDGYCTWMAYQVGQAAKTEQAEAMSEARIRTLFLEEMARFNLPEGATLTKDGDQYCALLGEDLQEGLAGFGATPKGAVEAFYAERLKRNPLWNENLSGPAPGAIQSPSDEAKELAPAPAAEAGPVEADDEDDE